MTKPRLRIRYRVNAIARLYMGNPVGRLKFRSPPESRAEILAEILAKICKDVALKQPDYNL
jgi:hypothetical protein